METKLCLLVRCMVVEDEGNRAAWKLETIGLGT